MKIGVGSVNPVKIAAVRELLEQYPILAGDEVVPVSVPSTVSEQPLTLRAVINGARGRAHGAFTGNALGIGIESGLMDVPFARSGKMNVCFCIIYDGREYFSGMSSAFELPIEVMRLIRSNEAGDLNHAFQKAGLTKNPKLGSSEGGVGLLTRGRVPRIEYTKQAVTMALIGLENAKLYGSDYEQGHL